MQRLWNKHSALIQIIGFIFFAGVAYASISTHEGRIGKLEIGQNKQEKVTDRMDYNIQIIARKIGVEPLKRADDE